MVFPIRGGRKAPLLFNRVALSTLLIVAAIHLSASVVIAAPPLSGYNPALLPYSPNGPFVDLSMFAADTVLPVISILDDSWRGDFTPEDSNKADVYWNAASGVIANGWRVAAFNRGEMLIDCNRDSIEFFYLAKKKRDLVTGQIYDADVKAYGLIANGVEVSHGRKLDNLIPGLSVGATVRYLNPRYLQDGTIDGYVIPVGPRSYDYNLFLDYAYSDNIVYKRKDEDQGSGFGFSADIGLSYRNSGWRAEVLMRDVLGTVFWDSVPYTSAYAVTPDDPTITNGYQDFEPSIKGYEGNKRHRQEIPLKTDLTLGYDYKSFSGSASAVLIDWEPRTWLEVTYRFNDDVQLSLGYNFDYSAVSYGLAAHGLAVGVTLSGFEIRDSRALGFQISYLYAW